MKTITNGKNKKSNIWAVFYALWHIVSAVLLLVYMAVDTQIGDTFPIVAPIFTFSLLTIISIAVAVSGTGFCTARFAIAGFKPFSAIVISCIIPVACTAVLTVIEILSLFGIGDTASDLALYIGTFGNGLFSVVGMLVDLIFSNKLGVFECYISFAVLIASSAVGYCLGTLISVSDKNR